MKESTKIKVQRGTIPEMVRNYILKRDGYQCMRCGSNEELAIDHIRPFSENGKTEIENLQTLCRKCNMEKAGKEEGNIPFSISEIKKQIASRRFSLKNEIRRTVKKVEKVIIRIALNETNWNRRKAGKLLDISYRSLLYKIKDYKIN